ncbi:MAG: rhodanese-like domain-containing protein [Planctomycetota bacterium]|nr:rhodanese-like domain-containing protein [Planctomycetota bacterium]
MTTTTPDSTIQSATPRQIQQWISEGTCVLIDVREEDEHARERIHGAILIPLSKFDPRLAASYATRGQRIAFYCRSGKRSADASRITVASLATTHSVVNMTGGIEGWKQDALPITIN